MRKYAIVGAAALLFAVVPAAAEQLSGDQIKKAIVGKSAQWTQGDYGGTISWNADGTQAITGNFGRFSEDSGTWRIEGNRLCSKWQKIRRGKEGCETFESVGDSTYKSGPNMLTMD